MFRKRKVPVSNSARAIVLHDEECTHEDHCIVTPKLRPMREAQGYKFVKDLYGPDGEILHLLRKDA